MTHKKAHLNGGLFYYLRRFVIFAFARLEHIGRSLIGDKYPRLPWQVV